MKSVTQSIHIPAVAYILCGLLLLCIILYLLHLYGLRKSRQRLEAERQRMNDLKLRVFTNLSHDLRTPMSMIITPLDQIMREHAGEPVAQELEKVLRSAHVLMDEIDQLLDFKQLKLKNASFHPAYGDIAAFTSEVCKSYRDIVGKDGDSLIVDESSGPVMTGFDREQMKRILYNIIGNAFKYRRREETVSVRVSVTEEDDSAVIRISDNGKGISDKAKQHLFERFFKEDTEEATGNGLGLNIAREFVKQHDGEITVGDNTPSGCVFTVRIPLNSEMKPKYPDGKRAERTGRPFILNVEENPEFRLYVCEHLSLKYDVVNASSGNEALELVKHNDFNLIICDQSLPDLDGREFCRALRADIRYANTPIIILTTAHGEEASLENLRAGADDTLEKPVATESLILRIERLLKRKGALIGYTDAAGHKISRADRELLDRITAEIEENLQESEYTIEALCSTLGMSRSGLYKKMMALIGKSPLEYIRILRLEKGREMLENGETSVSQIAWSIGFSPKQFSKHFKDEYGCLPSEYIHSLTN